MFYCMYSEYMWHLSPGFCSVLTWPVLVPPWAPGEPQAMLTLGSPLPDMTQTPRSGGEATMAQRGLSVARNGSKFVWRALFPGLRA